MRRWMLSLALMLPLAALAANPTPPTPPGPPARGDPLTPEQRQEMRRKLRDLHQQEMIVRLGLNDAEAARAKAALDKVNQKRDAIWQDIRTHAVIVRDAARGDTAAQAKVDAAIQRLFDARSQMQALDREAFGEISRGLDPQKKARLAIFFARSQMGGGKGGRFGHGPGMGPGGGPGGAPGPDEW